MASLAGSLTCRKNENSNQSCIFIFILIGHISNLNIVKCICIINVVGRFIIKVGLGISRTNADSQWNPVYNAFHRIFVVETTRFVDSSMNVNLTRQICGQRSSRAAETKRRALENYFSERICNMFLIWKCRGNWDLRLCSCWELAKRETLRNGDFRKKTCFAHRTHRNLALRSGFFLQVPKKCTELDLSLLYILIPGTYGEFAWENNFLALGVCFPQPCSSAGRRGFASKSCLQNCHSLQGSFAESATHYRALLRKVTYQVLSAKEPCNEWLFASKSRLQNCRRIVSFPQQEIRWNAL